MFLRCLATLLPACEGRVASLLDVIGVSLFVPHVGVEYAEVVDDVKHFPFIDRLLHAFPARCQLM